MYIVVRRYAVEPDAEAEFTRRIDEGFMPLVHGRPGFVAYYWAKSPDGEMFSVSIVDDETGFEEANRIAADFVRDRLADLSFSRIETIIGEVLLREGGI